MAGAATPIQGLTIFLLKEINDPKKALKTGVGHQKMEIDDHSTLYFRKLKAHPPAWIDFFGNRIDPDKIGKVNTSEAVLITKAAGRHFALTFGNGRFLLDPLKYELRFGLLTTLNAVEPDKIRSIDKFSLDRLGIQSRVQASRDTEARDFGIDIEQDLVRAVAGTPSNALVGERIAGFDSLHVALRVEYEDLRDRLAHYLKLSAEKKYLKNFPWIDQVREVRDIGVLKAIEKQLLNDLRKKPNPLCWMTPAEIIDWNEVCLFQFGGATKAPQYGPLSLDRFFEHIGGKRELTSELLANTRVTALRANDTVAHQWPCGRCLHAEVEHAGQTYILNAGKWYQIDGGFVDSINSIVSNIEIADVGLPEYNDAKEGDYNTRAQQGSNGQLTLFDAQNIQIGGGRSKIEFCDLYSRGLDLLHVKRYSSSAMLSHLFSQGSVSAQSFKSEPDFRRKVNDRLPAAFRIANPDEPIQANQYRIVYVIIGGAGSCEKLPFFSRVTLKNAFKLLDTFGYRVAVSHIPYAKVYKAHSTYRPGKAKGA